MSSQSKSSSSSLIDSANFAESIEDEDEDFDWYFIDASDFQSRDRAYVSGPLLPVVSADIDTGDAGAGDAGAGDAGAGGSAGATTGVAVLGPAAIMAPASAKRALDEMVDTDNEINLHPDWEFEFRARFFFNIVGSAVHLIPANPLVDGPIDKRPYSAWLSAVSCED